MTHKEPFNKLQAKHIPHNEDVLMRFSSKSGYKFLTQNKYEFFCYMRYFVYLCIRIYNYTYI